MNFKKKIVPILICGLCVPAVAAAPTLALPEAATNPENMVVLSTDDVTLMYPAVGTLKQVFESHGEKTSDYVTQTGDEVSPQENAKPGTIFFKKTNRAFDTNVVVPFKTKYVQDSSLSGDEEKVVQEGEDGVAVRTVVTAANQSNSASSTRSDYLTVIKEPKDKIVHVAEDVPIWRQVSVVPTTPPLDSDNPVIRKYFEALGWPYVWGGESFAEGGFDCSGLVYWVWKTNFGVNLGGRTAIEIGRHAEQITWDNLRSGDIIYSPKHIVTYIGNGMIIHAPKPGDHVRVAPLKYFTGGQYHPARIRHGFIPGVDKPDEPSDTPTKDTTQEKAVEPTAGEASDTKTDDNLPGVPES